MAENEKPKFLTLKNIGKKKFIVRGETVQEKPSKAHPKGRTVTKSVDIAPGQHKDVPYDIANDVLDKYPENFVEYVAPKPRDKKPEDKKPDDQKPGDHKPPGA